MRNALLALVGGLVLFPVAFLVGGAGWETARVVLGIEVGAAAFVLLVAGLTYAVVEAER
jgi:hypothetical protein